MSSVTKIPSKSMIEMEACEWISRLDGDRPLSPDDKIELQEWINQSPLHRSEIERLSKLWADVNIMTELAGPSVPKSRRPSISRSKPGFLPTTVGGRFATAAAVLLCAALVAVGVMWPGDRVSDSLQVFSTRIGEQKSVTLPDGTEIEMNTDTQIKANYDEHRRLLQLVRGEALFDVAPNKNIPFIVTSETAAVRAVGTKFSLQLVGQDLEVIVTEGRVEVAAVSEDLPQPFAPIPAGTSAPDSKRAFLEAGQAVSTGEGIGAVRPIDNEEIARKLMWRNGMLAFSGESLEYVIDQIDRYKPTKVEFADAQIANLRIGGYFKIGETDDLFEALEANFDVKVVTLNDGTIRLAYTDQNHINR